MSRSRFEPPRWLVRLARNPRFWFIVTIYPVLLAVFLILRAWVLPVVMEYPLESGSVIYMVCVYTCVATVLTILGKMFKRDLQGQKLQIRERQGINLDRRRD